MSAISTTLVRRNAIRRTSVTSLKGNHPIPKRMGVHRVEDCVTPRASSDSGASPTSKAPVKRISKAAKLKAKLLADRFCPLEVTGDDSDEDSSDDDDSFEDDDDLPNLDSDPASKLESFRRQLLKNWG
ncbi:uncharacterized protein MELLADRAFT_110578 [Melampsora larici-populina 98AG31]|uniref:Uncharacterized protein n=1 Tax=Melampsora larici-populina (strain 98AG31 / pathotype 3-4-7) TaxID=747676 RepID=F4S095_MELLP|nr:uncharacterized protein MELLADRAFT_110578 [Melampsora larici-populina 98AG31]EGG01922.1 hypothetical protein MELLADRAFT_110578 [Melampsora larici-populina 98AG31]